MKINKSLDIDLNIISPQKHIQIHEGDIDSIDIVLAVSVDDVSLDLTGLTIKYDATINNYLAEQDANGSVVENKIVIPVTENMTAMPGLLLVDVRMIQGGEILFTRTIRATVERAVVNGSTYIDFSKITIVQRMNALEEQMAHVEEIVDGLNTSKQITSIYRPPQTAPATVDVDFFRVGDTWICQGNNIVYKLIEAEYNYQPDPEVPAVHKFTWQSLNERFNFGTTEPPTSATYTEIEYVIGELTFNAFPVPEYFKGDTYAQLVSGEIQTLSVLTNAAEVSSGQYTYSWHEESGGSTDDKKIYKVPARPPATVNNEHISFFKEGDRWIYTYEDWGADIYTLANVFQNHISGEITLLWEKDYARGMIYYRTEQIRMVDYTALGIPIGTLPCAPSVERGDSVVLTDGGTEQPIEIAVCTGVEIEGDHYVMSWVSAPTTQIIALKENTYNKSDDFSMSLGPTMGERVQYPTVARMKEFLDETFYTRGRIDEMIGNIETALSEV